MRYRFLRFPDGKAKAVTFSYDDGCREDAIMAETLTRYGLKGTFNLNSEELRQGSGLSEDEVKTLILDRGHEVAVHGAWHRAEGTMRPIEGIRDVLDCRLELEKKYGRIIRGMAYPDTGICYFENSASYESVRKYLKELDIVYSRTLGGDNNKFELPADWYAWMPTVHHNNPETIEYIEQFINLDLSPNVYHARRAPRLFYIWGHSYEFETNNNWELLREICEKISGNDEIWYATNIEIYEYVNAYYSLIYSADGTIVYNPTLFTVWFDIDGKLYFIKPGETLHV